MPGSAQLSQESSMVVYCCVDDFVRASVYSMCSHIVTEPTEKASLETN